LRNQINTIFGNANLGAERNIRACLACDVNRLSLSAEDISLIKNLY